MWSPANRVVLVSVWPHSGRISIDPGNFTEVKECCLTCGQAADVFSWLALSRAVVRTQCGTVPARRDRAGTGLEHGFVISSSAS